MPSKKYKFNPCITDKNIFKPFLQNIGKNMTWLAMKTGYHYRTLASHATGRKIPTIFFAQDIAQVLEVHVSDIWDNVKE